MLKFKIIVLQKDNYEQFKRLLFLFSRHEEEVIFPYYSEDSIKSINISIFKLNNSSNIKPDAKNRLKFVHNVPDTTMKLSGNPSSYNQMKTFAFFTPFVFQVQPRDGSKTSHRAKLKIRLLVAVGPWWYFFASPWTAIYGPFGFEH